MQRALDQTLATLMALLGLTMVTPLVAVSTAQTDQCRSQSSGELPSPSRDDITDCVVEQLSSARIRLSISYTNFSRRGNTNTWLGADVLAGNSRLKWFGYRPAQILDPAGRASIEIVFGVERPPIDTVTTDQVELFMFVGKGEIFYRQAFNLKFDWKL